MLGEAPRLLIGLFVKIDQMRKDLARKATSDDRYTAYADTMQFVHGRRKKIEARFLAELDRGCGDVEAEPVPDSLVADLDQALADLDPARTADRQEGQVLDNIVSMAENRYSAQLQSLRSCLAARQSVATCADPLGPRAFCSAFRAALEPLYGLDLSAKLVLYKLFDKQVMGELEGLYARCLDCAEDVALSESATARTRAVREEKADSASPPLFRSAAPMPERTGAELDVASRSVPVAPGSECPESFNELRQLLARHRAHRANAPKKSLIATSALLEIISRLEQELGIRASGGSQAKLLRIRLRNELRLHGGGPSRSLTAEDEDTLDLVFLLFENIFQGNDLDDTVKDSIGRLQIPVVQLALEDKGFFDDRQHPARLLISHLAASTLGWVDRGDRKSASIPGRIEQAVRQVLKGKQRDREFYAQVDAEFVRLLDDELNPVREAEKRACREIQEREDHSNAEAVVAKLIDERLQAWDHVPEVVSSLVYEGWEQVMLAAYRDGGPSGDPWRRAVSILDRLLWSVQPKFEDDERRELMRGIPELLRILREGLGRVSYDQRRVAVKFRELQALHIAALRPGEASGRAQESPQSKLSQAHRPVPAAKAATVEDGASLQGGSLRPRLAVYGLRVGTWLEVRGDGEDKRVKLAWHGAESGVYLFVDRQGRRALELSDRELVSRFAQGLATIVGEADSPVVDRAIESLVRTLEVA